MKLHVGALPEDFEPDETWHGIVEPNPILLQFLAAPVAVMLAAVTVFCWDPLIEGVPLSFAGSAVPFVFAGGFLAFCAMIFVHELLHAVVHPGYGMTSKSMIGLWPSKVLFFAHYSGPMSRNRFLLVLLMPLIVLSVLPLGIAWLGLLSPDVTFLASCLSVCNAFCACGDVIGVLLVAFQIPSRAIIQNKGWLSFWKIP